MVNQSYTEFTPSHREAPDTRFKRIGDVPAGERIEISVYVKPRGFSAEVAESRDSMLAKRKTQHATDFQRLRDFAARHGLTVTAEEPSRRLIKLAGTADQIQKAFQTHLAHYHDGKQTIRARTGSLSLPGDLHEVVESVLGMDTRPTAEPRLVFRPAAAVTGAFMPNEVAALYKFPTSVTGKGQCIALIELGGGYNASDTSAAFKAMGLSAPMVLTVPVDGGVNKPKPDDGADGEVALDIQVAGGAAPQARIAVYFAPNTDAGFVDAITAAVHDSTNNPAVVSISWGSAESNWTQQAVQSMNSALQDAATLNVSVFVASGDSLATDGVNDGKAHVDFPASSPWAIGCGGTHITVSGQAVSSEVVWNDAESGGGGGISDLFPVPSFQQSTKLPPSVNDGQMRRGVPDVAGDAAPATGYRLVVNGKSQVVGGTSAVAPLWAGLTALINQGAAKPVGFLLPVLYSKPNLLRQITTGNNIPSGSTVGYEAGPGWNACTGLGVPDGAALFAALTGRTS